MALDSNKLAHFKSIGPAEVRLEIAEGKHGQAPDSRLWIEALGWADSEALRLSLESETRRDTREKRTLEIAENAEKISRRANTIAIASAIVASAATLIGVMLSFPK